MADHVDANSKGAGKSPRSSRPKRTPVSRSNPSTSHQSPAQPTSRVPLPLKRKSSSESRGSAQKSRRVEEEEKSKAKVQVGRSKSGNSQCSSNRKRGSESLARSTRELRKRKSTNNTHRFSSTSEESEVEEREVTKTDRGKRSTASADHPGPSGTFLKDRKLSGGSTGTAKTSARPQPPAGLPSSSSSGSSSTGTRHLARQTRISSVTSAHTLSSSSIPTKNKSKVKQLVGTPEAVAPSITGPSTSEEETKDIKPSLNISSRLRPTASRAAAAASLKLSHNPESQAGPSTHKGKGKASKPFKFGRKGHLGGGSTSESSATFTSQKTQDLEDSTNPQTTTDTDEPDETGSSSTSHRSATYQLRSQHCSDGSGANRKSAFTSARAKKGSTASIGSSSTSTLRGAHILSEKEKTLQRKPTSSLGGKSGSGGTPTSTSSGVSTNSTRSGRLSSLTTKLSASNTGACTSSRCGRGGGPSASGTIGALTKPGEAGMSTTQPSSTTATSGQSTSGTQATSSTTTPTGPTPGSSALESGTSASTLTAAAAATSAFGRGLAMLTGESDGDEGEMGRLQALLEARGLPPHLFGSLAPRMQQLLNRGMNSTTVSKAQQLLQGLQAAGDEGQQLQAAIEMCQLLVMGNEDTLAGFPVKQTVPALITLLSMEHNFDMMNHACRALTYMMEALPRSTPVVAEAVPVFLEKLQVIQCMDVAEQSLTALEMLSRRHAKTILLASGVNACLTYLDFFSITAQRAALAVTANCCQSVHSDEFHLISNSLGFLAGRLTEQDKKSVESVCLTFSRLVDSFTNDKEKLEEIASQTLLANLQHLLVVTPPVVSTGTFILILRLLAQLCSRCPKIGLNLLEQNIVSTLSSLLLGSSAPNTDTIVDEVELVPRNPQELLEIVTVIGELLPKLPKDGIFTVNTMMTHPHLTCQDAIQWQWRDDRGGWTSYSAFDSRIIEAAHQSGEDEISLTLQSRTYTIDFLGMQQLNDDTGTARHVQRKINPFYNPRAPVPADAAGKLVEEDVRSSYLGSHPDFTLPFLRPLFALLSEANSSSAGPAVRQICVKTLLRIVHFLSPESLQKTLRPQQVSNNLASMLGSSDLKIVVGAFQLSTLFMDKLTDIYMIHFRREGVFHQVSRISTSEVVGPSPIKSEISTILGSSAIIAGGSCASSSSSGISSAIPTVSSINNNPISLDLNLPLPCPLNPSQHSNSTTSEPLPPEVDGTGGEVQPCPTFPPLLHNSPFGLCLGGFFMQPGAASSSTVQLATTGAATLSSVSPSVPDAANLNLPVIAPQTSLESSLGGVILGSEVPPIPPPHAQIFSPIYPTRGLSSASSLGSSSDLNSPNTGTLAKVSGSTSAAEKKAAEAEQSTGMDQFKRKRTSKRPIPTSSSARRLRQDEPNPSGTSSDTSGKMKDESGSSSSGQPQGSTASGRRSGGKSSGFFASLHPSRWTRGSGGSAQNPGVPITNNQNNNNNNAPATASSVGGSSSSSTSATNINLARTSTSSAYLAITYKEQIKSWLKEQSIDFTQKYCSASTGEGMDTNSTSSVDGILPKLGEIISDLRNEKKVLVALEELRTVVLESDVSPFEVNHSGLIGALLGFLVDTKGYSMSRDQRLRSFIHVFANCPLNELSGESLEECLGSGSKTSAFSSLVVKLNSCLSQLEQFQVKVHEVPTSSGSSRVAPSSALRFFNTHQLKCVLQRHPNCSSLRQWKGGPVKIDPLALVQAIERYLIVRGFGRPKEPRDSGDSDEDNSDDDIDDSLAAVVISQGATRHKLQFIMNDQILPYNMTVYQAIRQFGIPTMDLGSELEGDFIDPTTAVIGSSGIWSQTHTIYYRPLSEDGVSPAAIATTTSKTSRKSKSPSSKGLKSKKDPLWHEGIVPIPEPQYVKYLSSILDSVTITDPSLPVLTLMRVIHGISRHWHSLYWPVLPGLPLIPNGEFINTKVAAKAQRQLQDPVVIMTGNLPCWLQQIGNACPFLFPFETRQMLFYSTSFDRDRALQRLLDSVPELNSQEREDRVTPRLDRRKRTISRDQILAQAEQLMQDFGSSRPLLEVQYENEVGTGLGPTLEFYALVSQELQKKELELWHCESSIGDEITSEKSKSYVQTSVGLFPKPLGKSVKTTALSKVKSKFKFIGKFMAKAVMDSRMIDIPLSKTQYKWILGAEASLCLGDMADVDLTVAQSIRKLVSVVSAKKKLELTGIVGSELNEALEALALDGCRIDNLGLDFTLPGHPTIELRKGGRDTSVTIYNLEEYIKLVVHWMLVGGVSRQMESWREGFDAVFPSSSLRIFYPEELEMVFCGANQSVGENWDMKTLSECCRPDHGFTIESRAIQFLFEVMASYDAQERRKFVQFVTGSPRLPVGGFKALQPQLTIVRKTIDTGDEDAFLPSVMTCVNYLKLPDYSTIEIMRERLRVAAEEGQMSFHLS